MKILFVSPGANITGGAEISLQLLMKSLVDRGCEVHVATLAEGSASASFADAGAILHDEIRMLGASRHGGLVRFAAEALLRAKHVVGTAWQLRNLARSLEVDIVHSNGFRSHVLAPVLATSRIPQVWSLRDVAPSSLQRWILRQSARFVSAVAANSEFTASQLNRHPQLVAVVGNPVVMKKPREVQKTGRPVIAVVAALHESKGHDLAIDVMARFGPDVRPKLIIAGDVYPHFGDDYKQHLERKIKELGLEDDIELLGAVPDIERVYARADILLHPAIYPEGFGRTIVEAQLAGVPVVATGIGGVCELVANGESGLLVPANDVDAMAKALREVLSDETLRNRLIQNGRSGAERFTPDQHVEAVFSIYEKVLKR